jgi:hypothetical protein
MLVPYQNANLWFDTVTNYVFAGSTLHNGDPNKHFCDPGFYMTTLTGRNQANPAPSPDNQWSVVVICPKTFDVSPFTGEKLWFTVLEAMQNQRIALGQHMDFISQEIAIAPMLFHEMFHAALGEEGSMWLI